MLLENFVLDKKVLDYFLSCNMLYVIYLNIFNYTLGELVINLYDLLTHQ